jgi:hypothetical protein
VYRFPSLTAAALALATGSAAAQGGVGARYIVSGGPMHGLHDTWGGHFAIGLFPGNTWVWSLELGLTHFPSTGLEDERSFTSVTANAAFSSIERRVGIGFRPVGVVSVGLARALPETLNASYMAWYPVAGFGGRLEAWLTTRLGLVAAVELLFPVQKRRPEFNGERLGITWRW